MSTNTFGAVILAADVAVFAYVLTNVGEHAAGDVVLGARIVSANLSKEVDIDPKIARFQVVYVWRALEERHMFNVEQRFFIQQCAPFVSTWSNPRNLRSALPIVAEARILPRKE